MESLEKWHVGAAAIVVLALVLACKGGKTEDAKDAPAASATAIATPSPVASVAVTATASATASANPTVKPSATAEAKGPPLPAASVDQVEVFGLGSGATPPATWLKGCPPGWLSSEEYYCNRPCKTDAECHAANKCQHKGALSYCAAK